MQTEFESTNVAPIAANVSAKYVVINSERPITQVRRHGLVNEQLFAAVYEMVGGSLETQAAQN